MEIGHNSLRNLALVTDDFRRGFGEAVLEQEVDYSGAGKGTGEDRWMVWLAA